MKQGNINDCVYVLLTPYGEKIWAEHWTITSPEGVPKAIRDAAEFTGGRTRFQLWQLMDIFGGEMYMGNVNQCFAENKIWYE